MMNPLQQITDATIADAGHRTAQGGAITTMLGWATSSQGTAIIGISIGLIGLGVQWYFRWKQDKRDQAEHDKRMGLLE